MGVENNEEYNHDEFLQELSGDPSPNGVSNALINAYKNGGGMNESGEKGDFLRDAQLTLGKNIPGPRRHIILQHAISRACINLANAKAKKDLFDTNAFSEALTTKAESYLEAPDDQCKDVALNQMADVIADAYKNGGGKDENNTKEFMNKIHRALQVGAKMQTTIPTIIFIQKLLNRVALKLTGSSLNSELDSHETTVSDTRVEIQRHLQS